MLTSFFYKIMTTSDNDIDFIKILKFVIYWRVYSRSSSVYRSTKSVPARGGLLTKYGHILGLRFTVITRFVCVITP